jgi:hypothetical protein
VVAFASGLQARMGAASCVSSLNELALVMIADEVMVSRYRRVYVTINHHSFKALILFQNHTTHAHARLLESITTAAP